MGSGVFTVWDRRTSSSEAHSLHDSFVIAHTGKSLAAMVVVERVEQIQEAARVHFRAPAIGRLASHLH
jgi:hypothetical protein